ncbi:hypothetical protein GCM10017044_06250 [Kordiimonas sediminis]|uniref:CAAX prenyl protease 2/Lysostaphin resistance protein A-like domain-containing protein n=1 Tax=Kordiimonas sediminis TaxID=1735581 RepID=A0A919E548_9PROT|nr:CPBP family intramembrane glutamic endopeptidase [Kordiimonas sediminis]GHF14880.1 hypothetical protein GCM10017044_06250 [Kordiimonas sediminis]
MSALTQASLLDRDKIYPAIGTFLAITALLCAIVSTIIVEMGLKKFYLALLMWTPALAAYLTMKLFRKNWHMLGIVPCRSRPLFWSYLLPLLYGGMAYGLIWALGLGAIGNEGFYKEVAYLTGAAGWSETRLIITGFILLGTIGMLWHITTSFGEELGWRGFLVLQLYRKMSFFWTAVFSGLVWASWHMPIILFANYNAGPEGLWIQVVNFTILCVSMSFPMAYYRITSGSVLPATLMHAAHNVFVLSFFHPLTLRYDFPVRYTGEFGLILPAVIALFALFYWNKASKEGISGPIH